MEKEAAQVFAEVEHVDQIRAAIRGCTYFDERRVDDYVVFNYKVRIIIDFGLKTISKNINIV